MSGHSKWATIKHKKAKTDAVRGKIFTKLLKEITTAAKIGGGDPAGNARLRLAVDKARENNMPAANIERAIKKGTGELEGVSYHEITYEGYGPAGVAILVEAMTDNPTRTVSELRNVFSKHGGNLGSEGCVAWMFKKVNDTMEPSYTIKVEDKETAEKVLKLMEILEDNDDVQNVHANFDIPESLINEI